MNPRRLQSATILSMVTASVVTGGTIAATYTQTPRADLRIPLRQRAHLRGHATHDRRSRDDLRGVRRPGAASVPPDRRSFQGFRLLQHRLRHQETREGDPGRRRVRREEDGGVLFELELGLHLELE